jgi:hypothetical protein
VHMTRTPQSADLTFLATITSEIAPVFRNHFLSSGYLFILSAKKTMLPGEPLLAAFLQVLSEQLWSREVVSFARRYEGLGKKLVKWGKALSRIEAVVHDADEKQLTNSVVKEWLDDLRDLAYDLDDILDEFATEASTGENQASTRKVRTLIPTCCTGLNPTAVKMNIRLGSEIKEITNRLNYLVMLKDLLNVEESGTDSMSYRTDRTEGASTSSSAVTQTYPYGREKDKESVINLLLGERFRDAEVSVLPIVGMGGVGKTTLAQLVYIDEKVQSFFDIRAWACISEDFDVVRVTKTILELVTGEHFDGKDLNYLQVKLREKLKGKRFLVVLDDLWNENYHDWMILCAPFEAGASRSAIVITTRNQSVASKTGTIPAYHLDLLSYDACLSVFTEHALGASDFGAYPNLQDIGEEIVKRCNGLPLAAKTLGGLLRIKLDRNDWKDVLESEVWDIPEERSGIFPALMLSYHHLSSHLKRCFAYCSVLPKDYEFEEKQLVLLWMAEGLIHSQENGKQMEDLGSEYFHDLLSRSFFQQSSTEKSRFVMHDLVNDLAQWVAKDLCFRMGDGFGQRISRIAKRARHLSYLGGESDGQMFEGFSKLTCLRTFLHLVPPEQGGCHFDCNFPLQSLSKLRRLRVLSLSGYNIIELPESIGDLKHLRYLDLSNTSIKSMPESTTTLYNLQALILDNCSKLMKLPSMFQNLVNMRHLNIQNACSLEGMPPKMGKLTCLQTLSDLVVGKGPCSGVEELGPLLHLRETLNISRLENVIQPSDATNANLIQKAKLGGLLLEWSHNLDEPQDGTIDLEVLNELQPHKDLKELIIRCYGGKEFSTWLRVPSFPNMVLLRLENCKKCTSLPSVGQLSSLKFLSIIGMAGVQKVGPEFYEGGCSRPFGSLETLCFENMEKWESWIPCGEFPHLRELYIQSCPKLLGKLPDYIPLLERVEINGCPQLQERPRTRVVQDIPQVLV